MSRSSSTFSTPPVDVFARTLGYTHFTLEITAQSLSKKDAMLYLLIEKWQHITQYSYFMLDGDIGCTKIFQNTCQQ